jgi:RNA polymerase sigma-54 factor
MPVLELAATQHQEQRAWPALLALARLLALPGAELEIAVEREASENPALYRDVGDESECAPSCAWCAGADAPRLQRAQAEPVAPEADRLLADTRAGLSSREAELAEYVVASLDHRGLLGCSLAALGRETGASVVELQHVVAALRAAGPVSIAASDVHDALLLQLDAMGEEAPPLVRALVEGHMRELATGAFGAAGRAVGATRAEVVEARDFIRARLQPPSDVIECRAPAPTSRPDIVIVERPGRPLEIDLPDARHVRVRVDPLWRECANDATRPAAERALANELVVRARAFARRLEDRRRTIDAIAGVAIERQERYVRGQGPPLPLTRGAVARGAGVHESTVSRAVAGKLVQLASGRTVEFASFFRASLGVEEALARVVAAEDRPLSDSELAGELDLLGFPVARRTVSKYRARLGIVPYTVR